MDELGIDVPTTWEELSDAVDKAKEAGYGGIITYQSAYAFYSFFYQNECPVIDTSGDVPKVVIDNEEGKEAWNYICDLISKGGLVESFKEATTWDKVYESFANGEATFLLGGDWCSTGVENINPDMDYGIAPMVKGKTEMCIRDRHFQQRKQCSVIELCTYRTASVFPWIYSGRNQYCTGGIFLSSR